MMSHNRIHTITGTVAMALLILAVTINSTSYSNNDGTAAWKSDWTELHSYGSNSKGSASFELTPDLMSADTRIRFRIQGEFEGKFRLDDVQVASEQYAPATAHTEYVEASVVHDQGIMGTGVTVAVVDTGIDQRLGGAGLRELH